jgi:RCC1 and BTB domain-containing protein
MKINYLSNKKIVLISCGDYHSAALSENGELYTWGGGGQYNRGQCGHGDLRDVDTPKKIEFFKVKKIMKVVCGGYHTIILLEDNNLFGFGKGTYGQCGWGVSEDISTPKLIKFSRKSFLYEQVYY